MTRSIPRNSLPCSSLPRRMASFSSLVLFALSSSFHQFPGAFAAEMVDIRGPDVTIIAAEEKTIFEYRQNGILRMVRIVPKWGKPYYLVPSDATQGIEDLERADTLIPSWVIVEF